LYDTTGSLIQKYILRVLFNHCFNDTTHSMKNRLSEIQRDHFYDTKGYIIYYILRNHGFYDKMIKWILWYNGFFETKGYILFKWVSWHSMGSILKYCFMTQRILWYNGANDIAGCMKYRVLWNNGPYDITGCMKYRVLWNNGPMISKVVWNIGF
jgi:hypothetical protein